jgi:hypothetical protein
MAESNPTAHERAARGQSRPAVVVAALLYLITAYQRTPCPCVALCIVRHLECLAGHEAADPVIRQICSAARETWSQAARNSPPARGHSPQPERSANPTLLH